MPVAPNTSASMIVRTTPPTPNTSYSIYNLGQNKILAGQSVLNGIGDWDFAGPGAVNWDFVQQTLDLFVSRPNPAQNATDFLVYNIDQRGNITKTPAAFLGTIGQPVQVAGFGYFFLAQLNPRSDFGQADMVTRTVTGNDATYRIYDTESDKLNGFITAAVVGDNFKTAGFGTFVPTDPNDLNNFAGLMVLRDSGTGQMLAYAFRDGALVNLPNEQNFAAIGDPWVVLGFGKFSSQVPLGMITRNTVTNEFLIYDINQTFDQNNTPIYTAASAGTLIKSTDGVNSNMTLAGFAPIAGSSPFGATFDMVLRDNSSGKFYFYDIQDDKLANSGELLQPPPPSAPIDQAWTVGGIAPDFSSTASAGATSQLVQAMAGFGGGSGAGDGLSTAPLGADTSQQLLLTTPQRA